MKKIIISMAAMAAAFTMASCDKELVEPENNATPTEGNCIIAASTESNLTKTALCGNDTDGYDVIWSEGDIIKIGSETFTLTEGAGTTKGVFTGNKLADGSYDAYYATKDGHVPANQTYTAGKITNAPMHATVTVTGGEASIANFKNIGGLLHLTIKKVKAATIKSIAVKGTLNASDTRIFFDCSSNPVTLTEEGSEFYIAMTEGTYTNFSVEMITTTGETLIKSLSNKSLVITRSQITNATFKTNTLNGHEFVNLGLPSGLLWATCNIGAGSSEEEGTYFAWGETNGKEIAEYAWESYKYGNSSTSLTKYCTSNSYGSVDNLAMLEPEDDAAFKKWKEGWRMPTAADYQELIDNCYWEWKYQYESGYSGPDGWFVFKAKEDSDKGKMCDSNGTGKIEGYSLSDTHIFLPAAGRILNGNAEYTSDCYYWTSSIWNGYSYSAQNFAGSSLNRLVGHYYRCAGEPIRAVCE